MTGRGSWKTGTDSFSPLSNLFYISASQNISGKPTLTRVLDCITRETPSVFSDAMSR
jgi:hypothetical protein